MTSRPLIILLTVLSLKTLGQTDDLSIDSINKEHELQKKQWSDNYKKTVKDSIDFTGILLDKFQGACGGDDASALLIFKVTKTLSKKLEDTVGVLIAHGCYSVIEKYKEKNNYTFRITSFKWKVKGDHIAEKYKMIHKYYFLKDLIDRTK